MAWRPARRWHPSCSGLGTAPGIQCSAGQPIPTTLAGHRFWEESDAVIRAQQRTALLKNWAIGGGLLLGVLDNDGAPSLRWRTGNARHQFSAAAAEFNKKAVATAANLSSSISESISETFQAANQKFGL